MKKIGQVLMAPAGEGEGAGGSGGAGGDGEGAGGAQPSVAELTARLKTLETELTDWQGKASKYKNQRKKLEQERDTLKSQLRSPKTTNGSGNGQGSGEGDGDGEGRDDKIYKDLFEKSEQKISKFLERAKQGDIRAALSAQLLELGVAKDRLTAALKLADTSEVEWTEDDGVDNTSIRAVAQKLKGESPFLFEGSTSGNSTRRPGSGGTPRENTISMADLNKITDPKVLVATQNKIAKGELTLVE